MTGVVVALVALASAAGAAGWLLWRYERGRHAETRLALEQQRQATDAAEAARDATERARQAACARNARLMWAMESAAQSAEESANATSPAAVGALLRGLLSAARAGGLRAVDPAAVRDGAAADPTRPGGGR